MTHSELIEVGTRFLKHQGYWMWLAEPSTTCVEKPDLIAWKLDASILLECKVSRADFLKDLKKPFRSDGTGMGNYRLYLTPAGLLSPDEIPSDWGLLEAVDKSTVRFTKRPVLIDDVNEKAERMLMYSWGLRKEKGWLKNPKPTGKRFRLILPSASAANLYDRKSLIVSGDFEFEK